MKDHEIHIDSARIYIINFVSNSYLFDKFSKHRLQGNFGSIYEDYQHMLLPLKVSRKNQTQQKKVSDYHYVFHSFLSKDKFLDNEVILLRVVNVFKDL